MLQGVPVKVLPYPDTPYRIKKRRAVGKDFQGSAPVTVDAVICLSEVTLDDVGHDVFDVQTGSFYL